MFYNSKKHLLSHLVSVFFLIFISGCQKEKVIINGSSQIENIKKSLSKVPFSYNNFDVGLITDVPHYFTSKIAFKEVRVFSLEKDNYFFAWIIDLKYTDLKELSKWKLGMILKPENKADFKDKILEKKGIKTIGVLTKTYLLEDEACIILQDFYFKPKNLQYVKFYLYSNTERPNLKFWQVNDVDLSIEK